MTVEEKGQFYTNDSLVETLYIQRFGLPHLMQKNRPGIRIQDLAHVFIRGCNRGTTKTFAIETASVLTF